jgi:[protein-PII] uridylyltransferase
MTTMTESSKRLPQDRKTDFPTVETVRSRLHQAMQKMRDVAFSPEERETQFTQMPMRYWTRVDEPTLRWHLETLHEFFATVVESEARTTPIVRWRHVRDRGFTEVVICTWDRLGLLAKVAGAFAEVDLNILRADVYTRHDHVVLDIFQVCGAGPRQIADETRLGRMREILDAALAARESVLLSPTTGPLLTALSAAGADTPAPKVAFDNERSEEYTILEVEARDRLGLLYALFRVLSDVPVNVEQAIITTENNAAGDVFYLADRDGAKIRDAQRLDSLRRRLLEVLT